jgi:hypothetical protein
LVQKCVPVYFRCAFETPAIPAFKFIINQNAGICPDFAGVLMKFNAKRPSEHIENAAFVPPTTLWG